MILSDLLGSTVRAPSGDVLGSVVDVRFRRGARRGAEEGDLELIALIVSPRSGTSFYGYERGTVNRPAVVAGIIRWIHRGSRIVPWECVSRVDRDVIHLGVEPPHIPLDTGKPVLESDNEGA